MLTEKERKLLEVLSERYTWIFKTINCVMVSTEKPFFEGGRYNGTDRIELGGFDVKFDCLEANQQGIKIKELLVKNNHKNNSNLFNKTDMENAKKIFGNKEIKDWFYGKGGPYTKVVISQNGFYVNEVLMGIPFEIRD